MQPLIVTCPAMVSQPQTSNLNLIRKVLDFIKSGGPELTVDRTVFELWLGGL